VLTAPEPTPCMRPVPWPASPEEVGDSLAGRGPLEWLCQTPAMPASQPPSAMKGGVMSPPHCEQASGDMSSPHREPSGRGVPNSLVAVENTAGQEDEAPDVPARARGSAAWLLAAVQSGRRDEMFAYMQERFLPDAPPPAEDERAAFAEVIKRAVKAEAGVVRCTLGISALEFLRCQWAPTAASGEPRAAYLLRADILRHLAEAAVGEDRAAAASAASASYADGAAEASSLHAVHPTRLSLAVKAAVFHHDVMQDTDGAIQIVQVALGAVVEVLHVIPEEYRELALPLMQALVDNDRAWRPEACS
jgi:hypothetical protein